MKLIEWYLNWKYDYQDFWKVVDGVKVSQLRRWFIKTTPEESHYLHKMVMSDNDPDPHNHPWDFRTFILWRGYVDEQYSTIVRIDDGQVLPGWRYFLKNERMKLWRWYSRPASHLHRVRLINDKPAWTYVIVGKYDEEREWGFVKPDGSWVYWRTYLGITGKNPFDKVDG